MPRYRMFFSTWAHRTGRPGMQLFLCCAFLVMLCWPMLSIADAMKAYWAAAAYLFSLWVIMIAVALLIAVVGAKRDDSDRNTSKGPCTGC